MISALGKISCLRLQVQTHAVTVKHTSHKIAGEALMPDEKIFDPTFVSDLFGEMAATYGITNYVSSFGFCQRWRKHCVQLAKIEPGMTVCDLMTGMGECWHLINRQLACSGELVALDFCPEMCQRAEHRRSSMPELSTKILQEDFLKNSIPSSSADCVVSAFGIKTFSTIQKAVAAKEIHRILRPEGVFSLLEISVPTNPVLRLPYMFYLKRVIPLLGRIFLGNPNNYRLLGIYTEHFQNAKSMKSYLEQTGLKVEYRSLFFGCASILHGHKPAEV